MPNIYCQSLKLFKINLNILTIKLDKNDIFKNKKIKLNKTKKQFLSKASKQSKIMEAAINLKNTKIKTASIQHLILKEYGKHVLDLSR